MDHSKKIVVNLSVMMRVCCLGAFAVAVLFVGSPAFAATTNWSAATGDWSVDANWSGVEPIAGDTAYINNGGTATISQSGEVCTNLGIGWHSSATTYTGALNVTGGDLAVGNLVMGNSNSGGSSTGTLTQSSGTITAVSPRVGCAYGHGIYNLSGGQLNVSDSIVIGYNAGTGTGTFNQTGGTHDISGSYMILSNTANGASGTYNLTSGTLNFSKATSAYLAVGSHGVGVFNFGNAAGTGSITQTGAAKDMQVGRNTGGAGSTFRGHGTVGLTGALRNNGRVIADGYGTDRVLDMSSFSSMTNTVDNTTTNGWFAQNHGKLLLDDIAVSGDSTVYWGEQGDLDLVNSVKFAFTGASGNLTGSLLATDRSDVDIDGQTFIGVWDFSGPTFTSVDMSFRFDDAMAALLGIDESDLQVFHYSGSGWDCLGGTIDTTNNTISVDGVDSFSQFAVGIPEPATMSLLLLGLPLVLRRRMRK